jgi:hypothetical protein
MQDQLAPLCSAGATDRTDVSVSQPFGDEGLADVATIDAQRGA